MVKGLIHIAQYEGLDKNPQEWLSFWQCEYVHLLIN